MIKPMASVDLVSVPLCGTEKSNRTTSRIDRKLVLVMN